MDRPYLTVLVLVSWGLLVQGNVNETELFKDLFERSAYDPQVLPSQNSKAVEVNFGISLQEISDLVGDKCCVIYFHFLAGFTRQNQF